MATSLTLTDRWKLNPLDNTAVSAVTAASIRTTIPDKNQVVSITYMILKALSIIFILFTSYTPALAQRELKYSLSDLKRKLDRSGSDTDKVILAIKLSNFFLLNKAYKSSYRDSSFSYVNMAEALGYKINFRKGIEDALVLKARLLLMENKLAEVHEIMGNTSGVFHCRLQLVMGRYFLEKEGEEKSDIDQAETFFKEAELYAYGKGMPNMFLAARLHHFKLMLEKKVPKEISNDYMSSTILMCKKYNQTKMESLIRFADAEYEFYNNRNTSLRLLTTTYQKCLSLKDTTTAIDCLHLMASYQTNLHKWDMAEVSLMTAFRLSTAMGYKYLPKLNEELGNVYFWRGNYPTALKYSLVAAEQAEKSGSDEILMYTYYRLGNICNKIGLKEDKIEWFKKSLYISLRDFNYFEYPIYRTIAEDLIAKGQARQVLKNLDQLSRKHPHIYNTLIKADCYAALGQSVLAEKYYMKVVSDLEKKGDSDLLTVYNSVAAFFVKQKEFSKADYYVKILLSAEKGLLTPTTIAHVEMLKFSIDSANGKCLEAIGHFQYSKMISDAIYNQTTLQQSKQLQLQYATAKRALENLQLRRRNILEHNDLEKESQQKIIVSVALLVTVLLIALMIYLYKLKQQTNIILTGRQVEIHSQNKYLRQLVQEKEWLMKEIHHRVKNNLQIVSSLLNTQSSLLTNEEAKAAIRDSQNRMQAIAIIHQKLYQSGDITSVNLKSYIGEISKSIIDSFSNDSNIGFVFEVEDAELSSKESVPMGLILNEAITNSVKYAFPEGHGIISIFFEKRSDDWYQLTIRDNGKGLPDNFDIDACTSLGINLMSGLSEQLMGNFGIRTDCGTILTIAFPSSPPLSH